jgi:hypothetical protein
MNQIKQARLRRPVHSYAIPALLLVLALGVAPEAVRGQWTTSGGSTTTTGNVGIGTATPTTKLDVAGVSKTDALSIGGAAAEKTFTVMWNNAVANQKVLIHWPASTQVDGIFEVTVTGHYWYSNSNGGIRKRIVINGRGDGVLNMQQSEVPFRLGFTGSRNTISDIKWDATNKRYYFIVANLDGAQNGITIHVKSITPLATPANADNLVISPIYTTDATVYPELFTSFVGSNVGVGTSTPAYALDVNGEINATGLRINGTPISTAGGGTPSQWTTSGANVYYNSGNVGVGTTAPSAARLHLQSPSNTYLRIGAPLASQSAIAFDHDTNVQDIVLYRPGGTRDFAVWTATANNVLTINQGGNIGMGGAPAAGKRLYVVGDLEVTGNINAKYQDVAEWVESSQKPEAGTVVALDPERSNQVLTSSEAYDTKVAGVVSAQPGISLGERGEGKVLVATTGRVKVKVDASRTPIKIGDLLVTSDVAGMAMKSEPVSIGGRRMHAPGTLIGKALEPLAKGTGEILVLLSLQ